MSKMDTDNLTVDPALTPDEVVQLRTLLHQGWIECLCAEAVWVEVSEGYGQAAWHLLRSWQAVAVFAARCNKAQPSPAGSPLETLLGKKPAYIRTAELDKWRESLNELQRAAAQHAGDLLQSQSTSGNETQTRDFQALLNWVRLALAESEKALGRVFPLPRRYPFGLSLAGFSCLIVALIAALYIAGSLFFATWNPYFWATRSLGDMRILSAMQDWGNLRINSSVEGRKLRIGGQAYETGLGTHANSKVVLWFGAGHKYFSGSCGPDSEMKNGTVAFKIMDGNRQLFDSGMMKTGEPARPFKVDVEGLKQLTLMVSQADGSIAEDHADWVDLKVE